MMGSSGSFNRRTGKLLKDHDYGAIKRTSGKWRMEDQVRDGENKMSLSSKAFYPRMVQAESLSHESVRNRRKGPSVCSRFS